MQSVLAALAAGEHKVAGVDTDTIMLLAGGGEGDYDNADDMMCRRFGGSELC